MFEPDDFEYSEWGSAYKLEEFSDTGIVPVNIHIWRRFVFLITLLAGGFIAGIVLLISSRISFSQIKRSIRSCEYWERFSSSECGIIGGRARRNRAFD